MIQPRDDIVWIVTATGELAVFDAGQLARSIQRTAPPGEESAFDDIGRAISEAVDQHLRDHRRPQPATTQQITEMVQALLEMLGYRESARRYAGEDVLREIRLDRLAADAGRCGSFELGFYRRLDQVLAEASQDGPERVRMRGLRACVLQMRGARRWSRQCRRLAEEIIDHVWARAVQLPQPGGRVLELAVLD